MMEFIYCGLYIYRVVLYIYMKKSGFNDRKYNGSYKRDYFKLCVIYIWSHLQKGFELIYEYINIGIYIYIHMFIKLILPRLYIYILWLLIQ